MNSRIERMEKMLGAAILANDKKVASRLVAELMQEWSLEIGKVIQPITPARLPFIVAVCEQYAQVLRDIAPPDAPTVIDVLKSIRWPSSRPPVKGDHDE